MNIPPLDIKLSKIESGIRYLDTNDEMKKNIINLFESMRGAIVINEYKKGWTTFMNVFEEIFFELYAYGENIKLNNFIIELNNIDVRNNIKLMLTKESQDICLINLDKIYKKNIFISF